VKPSASPGEMSSSRRGSPGASTEEDKPEVAVSRPVRCSSAVFTAERDAEGVKPGARNDEAGRDRIGNFDVIPLSPDRFESRYRRAGSHPGGSGAASALC